MKLGRRAPNPEKLKLIPKLSRYVSLPSAPPSVDWTKGITSWGMMLNGPDPSNPPQIPDGVGDCVIAGIAHAIQVFTLNASTEATVSNELILDRYESWAGYVLGDESTDNGAVEISILHEWHKKKHFGGHTLEAYADPNVSNLEEIKSSVAIFGPLFIGLDVPQSVMDNSNDPSIPWDVGGDESIAGGHCVIIVGYETNLKLISWGNVYEMTPAFWQKFVQEAHTLLSPNWLSATGFDPTGLNLAQLQADLAEIH